LKAFARNLGTAGQLVFFAGVLAYFPLSAQDKAAESAWKKATAEAESALKKNQINQASDAYSAAVIQAEKLGTNDSRLAETLRRFGAVRLQLGETPDAESAFRRALALEQKRIGTNDIRLAELLLDLGDVCMDMNRFEEADDYFVRAQALVEHKFGRYDRTVGICLQFRGEAALEDDRLPEAEKLLKESLELAESPRVKVNFQINQYVTRRVQLPNKGQLAAIHDDLGVLYRKMKRYDDSEKSLKQSISLYETQYSKTSLHLCNPLFNSAQTYVAETNYVEAAAALRRCLAILKAGKSDAPLLQTAQKELDALTALEKKAASPPPAH
jgi:tetratricopeptide (TPR) repeat protein